MKPRLLMCTLATASVAMITPAWAVAAPNSFGVDIRDNSNGTIKGTRSGIESPTKFNILSGSAGLMRVASQGGSGTSGLIQIGYTQINGVTVDNPPCSSDPGQLYVFDEYHPAGSGSNGYVCDRLVKIGSTTKTYRVQNDFISGVHNIWAAWYDGDEKVAASIGYDGAAEVYAGGELTDHTVCNGNTDIEGTYVDSGPHWQRTPDAWTGGSSTWNDVVTSTPYDPYNQWAVGTTPSPFSVLFNNC